MFSAVYLAYCREFVTNDPGQWKALKAVAGLMNWNMPILMYEEFRTALIGIRS